MPYSTDRARADIDAGRLWKARDRLHGLLRDRQDAELLDLLATVHHEMHDLPAAGALWFVTGRDDDRARQSLVAWRERHGDDRARWRSIPSPVRHGTQSAHLRDLAGAAERVTPSPRFRPWEGAYVETWGERAVEWLFGLSILWALALSAIGAWTVSQWIWG